MPNSPLAQFSNVTLVLAIIVYALSMVAYSFDFAFARRRAGATVGTAVPRQAVKPALVGAPAASDLSGISFAADPADPSELADVSEQRSDGTERDSGVAGSGAGDGAGLASRWPSGGWLRSAFVLTIAGALLQVSSITARGVDEHRVPWGNMYEFIAAITCAAVLVLIVAAVKFRAYYMGMFVLLPVVLALAVDVVVIYTPAGQLVPALQSYWIAIHVTAMIVAIGMYIFGAVVTVMYLIVDRAERRAAAGKPRGGLVAQLPGAALLDRLAYRSVLFAFPAWTFAIIAGAIWADHAWGRYWGWDPKETWSFITWVVYAAYLHARATAGWRGKRAAVIHLLGFSCLLFNLVGINLWVTGLHSYAGIG